MAPQPSAPAVAQETKHAVAENRHWYHTIDLGAGVVTPGHVDLRKVAPRVLPADLSDRRAVDVGSFDGFWAFELERRGAEVVAIDTETIEANEWPPVNRMRLEREAMAADVVLGRGFRIAAAALASRVRRETCNVYDLAPERVGGHVDFAFSGTILLHLRDPVRALEAIYATLRPGGEVRLFEPFSALLSLRVPRRPVAHFKASGGNFNWWYPNLWSLLEWTRAAGFKEIRRLGVLRPASTRQMRQWYAVVSARRPA